MLELFLIKIKYTALFTKTFVSYLWYGLKQRVKALLTTDIGLFSFLKSLLRWPFEAWIFSRIDMQRK